MSDLKAPSPLNAGYKQSGDGQWWQNPVTGAYGHYTISRDGDITDYREHFMNGPAKGWTHDQSTGESSKYTTGGKKP